MTTSENTELYDLYIVCNFNETYNEDDNIEFDEIYSKDRKIKIHERLFETPGYRLYIKNLNHVVRGEIIGPMDKSTLEQMQKITALHPNYCSWIQKQGERPIIKADLKHEIEVSLEKEIIKKLKII